MQECSFSKDNLLSAGFSKRLNPRGFWRVDKRLDPEFRLTNLVVVALMQLEQLVEHCHGDQIQALKQFHGYDTSPAWDFPDRIRLADYGIVADQNESKDIRSFFQYVPPRPTSDEEVSLSWKDCENTSRIIFTPGKHDEQPAPSSAECEVVADSVQKDLF